MWDYVKINTNLFYFPSIIDSLEECSHCSDSAISVATVVLVCDLLTTVEHLVNGDSVEKIEEIHRINKIIEGEWHTEYHLYEDKIHSI